MHCKVRGEEDRPSLEEGLRRVRAWLDPQVFHGKRNERCIVMAFEECHCDSVTCLGEWVLKRGCYIKCQLIVEHVIHGREIRDALLSSAEKDHFSAVVSASRDDESKFTASANEFCRSIMYFYA